MNVLNIGICQLYPYIYVSCPSASFALLSNAYAVPRSSRGRVVRSAAEVELITAEANISI